MTVQSSPAVLTASQLAEMFAVNTRVIGRQIDGLSHEDSLLQLPTRGNCLNWVLGHIAVHRDFVLEYLGQEKVLGDEVMQRYDRGSEPITGDGPGVLPLETIVQALDEAQKRITETLERMSPSDLLVVTSDDESKSLASRIHFLAWHETYHTGQTEVLRQIAGTDDQVI